MKLLCFLAGLSILNAGVVERPALAEIKTVYLLPMSNALDQFLAIRLTQGGILQVVTDPKQADAIITDHIGTSFEDNLNTLFGEKEIKEKDKDKKDMPSFATPASSSTRSKGAVFLVERKSRSIIWSDYVRPKNTQPDELHHVAERIADQLEKEKKGKKDK